MKGNGWKVMSCLSVILMLSILVALGFSNDNFSRATLGGSEAFQNSDRKSQEPRFALLQTSTVICVDPSNLTIFNNKTCSINVRIANVTDLCGWEFSLYWNNSVLNCTSATPQVPTEWQPDNWYNFSFLLDNNYNATHGHFFSAIAFLRPALPFNGSTNVATLTFKAMQPGTSTLTIAEEILGDIWSIRIPHTKSDGSMTVYNAKCAMKTCANGYFYVPNLNVTTLKVEYLFNDTLVADQTGGSSPYTNITKWPDGTVNSLDALLISGHYGQQEGNANWEYMADIVADKVINVLDSIKVSSHYGNSGTYSTNITGVTVTFNGGTPITPDTNGFVQIPQNTANFTVCNNGNQTGALVVFGKSS